MTQTLPWDEAANLLESNLLHDTITIYNRGPVTTTGYDTSAELNPVQVKVAALVQTTNLANAVESAVDSVFSVKVSSSTPISAGQVIDVLICQREPALVGCKLLIDKVNEDGLSIIHKAIASTYQIVQQQGKE